MKYFTKEQIDALKVAEPHFNTVVKAQWKRATDRKMNDMIADIYEQCTGEKIKRDWACGQCVFNAYMKIGKLYFASIEKVEGETEPMLIDSKIEEGVTDNEPATVNNTPRKKGRPKKKTD